MFSFACSNENTSIDNYNIQVRLEESSTSEDAFFLHLKKYMLIVSPMELNNVTDTLKCFPAGEKYYHPSPVYVFIIDKSHWVLVGDAQITSHYLTTESVDMTTFQARYGDEGDYFFMDTTPLSNRVGSSFISAFKIEYTNFGYRLYYKKDPRSLFRSIAQDDEIFSSQRIRKSAKKRRFRSAKIKSGRIFWERDYDYSYLIRQNQQGVNADTILFRLYSFPFPEHLYFQGDTIYSEVDGCPKRYWGKSAFIEADNVTLRSHGIEEGKPLKDYWLPPPFIQPITIVSLQNKLPSPTIQIIEVPDVYHFEPY